MSRSTDPLVSVCVVAYNSARFVVETLDSIKAQTYRNIELIVGDDCSTDDTAEVCREWIAANADGFVRCELVCAPVNRGVAANCNAVCDAARGGWIKIIAGDDLLLPECIELNLEFVDSNPEAKVVLSRTAFTGDNEPMRERMTAIFEAGARLLELPVRRQFGRLIRGNCLPAATEFIGREIFERYRFDERIPLQEDHPYWIKLTKNGIKLYGFDAETVVYRLHPESLSQKPSIRYAESYYLCFRYYVLPNLILRAPWRTYKLWRKAVREVELAKRAQ